ncbi:hypothetical protein, partial [Cupriavidus laharis]|uniref:hypothetical protein n=1 Tax=Cupriavidus laharis TaxID=151654 RepID=UPI001CC5D953
PDGHPKRLNKQAERTKDSRTFQLCCCPDISTLPGQTMLRPNSNVAFEPNRNVIPLALICGEIPSNG